MFEKALKGSIFQFMGKPWAYTIIATVFQFVKLILEHILHPQKSKAHIY